MLTRWFQFGTFSPIFRIHGYVSETEIWRYSPEFEAMARKFIDLRYQLMPYIYSEAWKVTNQSHLLMSPLAIGSVFWPSYSCLQFSLYSPGIPTTNQGKGNVILTNNYKENFPHNSLLLFLSFLPTPLSYIKENKIYPHLTYLKVS